MFYQVDAGLARGWNNQTSPIVGGFNFARTGFPSGLFCGANPEK
jgi:hypothetical protein